MRWPFRRREPEPETGPAPVRPYGEWAGLAPMSPPAARSEASDPIGFQAGLASRWHPPPMLQPLAHELNLSAPAGLVSGIVAPVRGYPDAPELSWAGAPERSAPPRLPLVPPSPAPKPKTEEPQPQSFIRDMPTAPTAAPERGPGRPRQEAPPEAPAAPEPFTAPPAAEPPVPRMPEEPAPVARRLGRLGAPLHIDAEPPAVLRTNVPAQEEPEPALTPPALPALPETARPRVDAEPPVDAVRPKPKPTPTPQLPPAATPTLRKTPPAQSEEPRPDRPALADAIPEASVFKPAEPAPEASAEPLAKQPAPIQEDEPIRRAHPVEPVLPRRPLIAEQIRIASVPPRPPALLPGLRDGVTHRADPDAEPREPDHAVPLRRAPQPGLAGLPQLPPELAGFLPDLPAPARPGTAAPTEVPSGLSFPPDFPPLPGLPEPGRLHLPPVLPEAVTDRLPQGIEALLSGAHPEPPRIPTGADPVDYQRAPLRQPEETPDDEPVPYDDALPGTPDEPRRSQLPPMIETVSRRVPGHSAPPPRRRMGRIGAPMPPPTPAVGLRPQGAQSNRNPGDPGGGGPEEPGEPPSDLPDLPMRFGSVPGLGALPESDPEPAHAVPESDEQVGDDDGEDTDADTSATAMTADRIDGLAGQLYDRIRDRLRQELLVDRERALMLTDLR